MGADIDGGKAHQHVKGQEDVEQRTALGAPGKKHHHGADADMTAGEGSCGAFACLVGTDDTLVEEPLAVARHRQHLVVGQEVVFHIGEDAIGNMLHACCQIVVLRTRDRQEDKDDVSVIYKFDDKSMEQIFIKKDNLCDDYYDCKTIYKYNYLKVLKEIEDPLSIEILSNQNSELDLVTIECNCDKLKVKLVKSEPVKVPVLVEKK